MIEIPVNSVEGIKRAKIKGKTLDLIRYIVTVMQDKIDAGDLSYDNICEALDVRPSDAVKIVRGSNINLMDYSDHFNIKSISKLESIIGEPLIKVKVHKDD